MHVRESRHQLVIAEVEYELFSREMVHLKESLDRSERHYLPSWFFPINYEYRWLLSGPLQAATGALLAPWASVLTNDDSGMLFVCYRSGGRKPKL